MNINSMETIKSFFGGSLFPSELAGYVLALIERKEETSIFTVRGIDTNYSEIIYIN